MHCVRKVSVLVKSRKVTSRRWTVCLALLAVLALSSCKKADQPTANNSTSAGESSTSANSTTAGGDKTATTSSTPSSKSSKTLPPEIQKLGVKPTGTDCPSSAPIKGNLSKGAKKIYHEAKSKGYKSVKPEICFADVATAKKAGFEAPKGNKPQ